MLEVPPDAPWGYGRLYQPRWIVGEEPYFRITSEGLVDFVLLNELEALLDGPQPPQTRALGFSQGSEESLSAADSFAGTAERFKRNEAVILRG